jgi:acetyl/propionyl-CoA carboxylase alpha subunit
VISRLLIANRGEIALRIIRACREMGVESVAVYSEADREAPHAMAADRAIAIGPAAAAESYLSVRRIIDATRSAGADAIHPGYGFLSENAAFAEACDRAGIVFVGPPAKVIAQMGSKIDARQLMERAGVPVVPGETPDDQSDAGLRRAVEKVGLPALIKASAGGGGKGMRQVDAEPEIDAAIQAARREAIAAFGDGALYVEHLVGTPHHVEVQLFGDAHGQIVHLYERECSVQRRHQKIIEESPSPNLTAALRSRLTDAAVRAGHACGYRNAGTVEFLVDLSGGRNDVAPFYFLEMNTRLQVEHPVTEQLLGVDLVRAQLLCASGEPLPWTQADLRPRGHAIEARVYAEDPAAGFLPQAGHLLLYREPRQPGLRIDSGVVEGGTVPVHYDPMLSKVIASAETRAAAIDRLSAALRSYPILGVTTNVAFLLGILASPEFRDGRIDTAFLDRDHSLVPQATTAIPGVVHAALNAAAPFDGGSPAGLAALDWDPWSSASGWRP